VIVARALVDRLEPVEGRRVVLEVAGMRRTLSFSARKNDVSESNDMMIPKKDTKSAVKKEGGDPG
jgi:hypothetical protein